MLSFNDLKKNLKKDFSGFDRIKLAILSDSASQFLHTATRGYGYEAQVNFEVYEGDYDQADLQIFDPASELYAFKPDLIFVNCATEQLLDGFYREEGSAQIHFADKQLHAMRERCAAISARTKATVIINTLPEMNDGVFGNYAAKTRSSFIYQLRKINLGIMELGQAMKNVFVCDLASLQNELGRRFVFDPKMYAYAGMVYSLDCLPYIARHLTDIVLSIKGTFKKCLILDLDDTLWGGIAGEQGVEGIEIGRLGNGKIYTDLQLWAKQLKQRGIILAICSKNNEEIAKEPFMSHPDMVLRLDDIAVFAANWHTKAENIRYIQSILNIGFDSMVFLDNNRFEREMVRAAIPGITVPELPDDPSEYLVYLRSLNLFETASFTEEDEMRTAQYRAAAERTAVSRSFEHEHDFLASLNMVCDVQAFDEFTIPRVAQLTQRSNQFNLRTIRYTEEDLQRICNDPAYYTMSLTLADRFGDHGLIAMVILKKENAQTLFIDSWIMSCRVLKRGMENFTMNAIADLARREHIKTVTGEYIATKKNGIVAGHFAGLGFTEANGKWHIDVAGYEQKPTLIACKV